MNRFRETRDAIGETAPGVLTVLFWVAVVIVALTLLGTALYSFTAPANVAIESRTFHASQPYQDGMARDLDEMRMAYLAASPASQDAIRATVRQRYAGFNPASLPASEQAFLSEMMQ
ncbi:MAG: hypothetical protein ACRYGR_02345 [Janthinobacterium lividum]